MEPSKDFYCNYVLNKKIPVNEAKETDRVLAFHHTKPSSTIHIVIVPKEHVAQLIELADFTLIKEIFEVAAEIIKDMGLAETNYKIITNGGSYQDSQHLHFHLVSGKPIL